MPTTTIKVTLDMTEVAANLRNFQAAVENLRVAMESFKAALPKLPWYKRALHWIADQVEYLQEQDARLASKRIQHTAFTFLYGNGLADGGYVTPDAAAVADAMRGVVLPDECFYRPARQAAKPCEICAVMGRPKGCTYTDCLDY